MHSFPRAIAHIDADCFFASVELLDFPHLKGKPVLVCSRTDRRGIVLAATYEARPFGIRAGTPIFKAVAACPQAHILQSHFHKYSRVSHQLMQILGSFSPDLEVSSVDEAYMDLTGLRLMYRCSYQEIAARMQKTVLEKLGITVSIGLATTKTIAKIASDYKKPYGLTVVSEPQREAFLHELPVEKIAGVGRNTQALLNKYGIYTISQMMTRKIQVQTLLGKRGVELITELSGTSLHKVQQDESPQKSLSHTSTFHDFLTDERAIYDYSLKLLKQMTHALRERSIEAKTVTFFLMKKDFTSVSCEHSFTFYCNDDDSYIRVLREKMFPFCFRSGQIYRKAGFLLPVVRTEGPKQYSLFEIPEKEEKKTRFSQITDGLLERFGAHIIK